MKIVMKSMINYVIIICIFCYISCNDKNIKKTSDIVKEWQGKEILFSKNMIFTRYGKDTIPYSINSDYKFLLYVDSIGCASCKMRLSEWKKFISDIDSLTNKSIPFIFAFHPKNKNEVLNVLKSNGFNRPVFIDLKDETNSLNHFPTQPEYQCFLLDKDNKVLLVGNPVYNSGIKQLYLKIIKEKMQEQNTVH